MLFVKSIYDSIIFHLAQSKEHTVQSLHKVVNKEENISLPNFYKIIDQMIEKQMLVKEHGKISLHATWILSLFDLAEKVKIHYLKDTDVQINLQEGQQNSFFASSLWDLDNIWANLLSQLGVMYEKKDDYYFYNAHTYHILGMQETEKVNFHQFGKQTQKVYFLAGNQTFLDHYGASILRMQGTDVVCSDKVKFMKDGYCLNVIGDYIIEVLFPSTITQYFKVFFDTIKDMKDFNPELFQHIFKMKVECKLTIRRSVKDATQFKSQIKKFFK